jgi:hypothetical protein
MADDLQRRAEWHVMADKPDRWYRWRFGGNDVNREKDLTGFLYPVRDTVLDKAQLRPGDTVLDVGTGDGLPAFGALERLGPSGRVVAETALMGMEEAETVASGGGHGATARPPT